MELHIAVDATLISRILARIGSGEMMNSIVEDVAVALRNAIVGRTPVGVPPSSPQPGRAKMAWSRPYSTTTMGGDREVSFRNDVPYAYSLEYGSIPGSRPWPRVGPRTRGAPNTAGEMRIYSRQAPGGMFSFSVRRIDVNRIAAAVVDSYLSAGG